MTDVFQIRYVSKIYPDILQGDTENKKTRKSNKTEKHRKAIIYMDLY